MYDDVDNVDKFVVATNVLAACADALRDDVPEETVLVLGSLALVVAVGYVVAFNGKNNTLVKPYAEWIHAACVHGAGAVRVDHTQRVNNV